MRPCPLHRLARGVLERTAGSKSRTAGAGCNPAGGEDGKPQEARSRAPGYREAAIAAIVIAIAAGSFSIGFELREHVAGRRDVRVLRYDPEPRARPCAEARCWKIANDGAFW